MILFFFFIFFCFSSCFCFSHYLPYCNCFQKYFIIRFNGGLQIWVLIESVKCKVLWSIWCCCLLDNIKHAYCRENQKERGRENTSLCFRSFGENMFPIYFSCARCARVYIRRSRRKYYWSSLILWHTIYCAINLVSLAFTSVEIKWRRVEKNPCSQSHHLIFAAINFSLHSFIRSNVSSFD